MLQECARAVLIFACGFLLIRLSGRRIFAKWSALDVIVPVIAGSSLSRAMTGSAPLWATIAAVAVLFGLHWLLARLAAHSPVLSRVLEGRQILIAEEGRVDETARLRHSVSDADLRQALGQRGMQSPEEADMIELSPSGKIVVRPASEEARRKSV